MKAYEIHSDQPGLDALTLTERSQPQPSVGQVLVNMHAASLNYRDLLVAKGAYDSKQFKPIVPLSDGAGEVVTVGEGVRRVQVGDRVAGIFIANILVRRINPRKGKFRTGRSN